MKISGFTMVRNAGKYYFPIKESIQSVLPIVDEFIVEFNSSIFFKSLVTPTEVL